MNPTPPSSYMLRELKDVPIPDTVSWWPQTLGWQLLLLLVVLLAFFSFIRKRSFGGITVIAEKRWMLCCAYPPTMHCGRVRCSKL